MSGRERERERERERGREGGRKRRERGGGKRQENVPTTTYGLTPTPAKLWSDRATRTHPTRMGRPFLLGAGCDGENMFYLHQGRAPARLPGCPLGPGRRAIGGQRLGQLPSRVLTNPPTPRPPTHPEVRPSPAPTRTARDGSCAARPGARCSPRRAHPEPRRDTALKARAAAEPAD